MPMFVGRRLHPRNIMAALEHEMKKLTVWCHDNSIQVIAIIYLFSTNGCFWSTATFSSGLSGNDIWIWTKGQICFNNNHGSLFGKKKKLGKHLMHTINNSRLNGAIGNTVFNNRKLDKTSTDLMNDNGAFSPCTLITLSDHLVYFLSARKQQIDMGQEPKFTWNSGLTSCNHVKKLAIYTNLVLT